VKITSAGCTQFAGIRNKRVIFEDGINVVYGPNESGKSTLTNLISRTLFQNSKLDGRTDKDFRNLYLPGPLRSGVPGDYADGEVTFETGKGSYTLKKQWGAGHSCRLETPDGIVRDPERINEILREALVYGEGVWSDILLTSQRTSDEVLAALLDSSQKTDAKQEISDAVTMAFAQSGGISIDAIEEGINAKIKELEGLHWDYEGAKPQRPTRGQSRWARDLGEVLKAYYALEDANVRLEEMESLEADAAAMSAYLARADEAARKSEAEYEEFRRIAGQLAVLKERRENIRHIEANALKLKEARDEWPAAKERLSLASSLQKEYEAHKAADLYKTVKELQEELAELTWQRGEYPDSNEILKAGKIQGNIVKLESRLGGMKMDASIRMIDNHDVAIRSIRTGEAVSITNDKASITEAVSITVPGVMEMELMPAQVDAARIAGELENEQKALKGILEKYKAGSMEGLRDMQSRRNDIEAQIERIKVRIEGLTDGRSINILKEETLRAGGEIRKVQEIEKDIERLCNVAELEKFINRQEFTISEYEREYISLKELVRRSDEEETRLENERKTLQETEDIPLQFREITDSEEHLEVLKKVMDDAREKCNFARESKNVLMGRLEAKREDFPENLREEAEEAERIFREKSELLENWRHIRDAFVSHKAEFEDNSIQDLAESFGRYMEIITKGRVTSEFPNGDRLDINIYSDNRLMDFGKLSEGTKETVSLAFRLATLDHLFPEGGVVVLDDSFANMDKERTACACELIRECASGHQVILLTCKENLANALGGSLIRLG
jgi:exonuclease SbcC